MAYAGVSVETTVEISKSQDSIDKKDRERVLLVAYACSPYRGSEAGVGWHRAIEAAKYFDTWVIYGYREYKSDVRRYLRQNGKVPGLYFLYVPETRFGRWMWKLPKGYYTANNLWHRRAYRVAGRLHEKLHFDIVHQLTWCGYREPGYLWRLDAPFIWGPVGGTQNYPWRFLPKAGIRGAFTEMVRSIMNILQLRFQARVRKAARRAAILVTANSTGRRHFEQIHKAKPILQLDVGTAAIKDDLPILNYSHHEPLKILWSGIFEHPKALHLLIMALSKVPNTCAYELRILGEGPLARRWRRLAQRTGVERYCTWMGWLPHDQAMAQYNWADVFVFTSLRDTCGTVLIEALSRGVPVICLDHQGASDVITKECGIKIPVTKPKEVVSGLRNAIVSSAQDRTKLQALSHGAIERAKDYLWPIKGKQMAKVYNKIIEAYQRSDEKIGGIPTQLNNYYVSGGKK